VTAHRSRAAVAGVERHAAQRSTRKGQFRANRRSWPANPRNGCAVSSAMPATTCAPADHHPGLRRVVPAGLPPGYRHADGGIESEAAAGLLVEDLLLLARLDEQRPLDQRGWTCWRWQRGRARPQTVAPGRPIGRVFDGPGTPSAGRRGPVAAGTQQPDGQRAANTPEIAR
jgi:hypothetical protein